MMPIRSMFSKVGITEQQWRVLRVIEEFGPLEAGKVAEHSALLMSSQSRIVQTLVEKGMVTRSPDLTDRRKQLVSLTKNGWQMINDNVQQASEIAASLEQKLGRKKLSQLLDLLSDIEQI